MSYDSWKTDIPDEVDLVMKKKLKSQYWCEGPGCKDNADYELLLRDGVGEYAVCVCEAHYQDAYEIVRDRKREWEGEPD